MQKAILSVSLCVGIAGFEEAKMVRSNVQFGVVLPIEGAVSNGSPSAQLVLEVARKAEAQGFDSIWVGDRILLTPRLEIFTVLGAVAAITKNAKLGTSVLLAPLRNPILLAHSLASLDIISSGRAILGVGVGAKRAAPEFDSVQVEFGRRLSRTSECLRILRTLFSEKSVEHSGKHFKLAGVSMRLKSVQRPHPPIWIGGSSSRTLRWVVNYGDGWFPTQISPDAYRKGWGIIEDLARSKGRNVATIRRAFYVSTNISDDPRRAHGEAENFLNLYYQTTFPSIDSFGVFSETRECINYFEKFVEAGVEHFAVRFASFAPLQQMERFEREVKASF